MNTRQIGQPFLREALRKAEFSNYATERNPWVDFSLLSRHAQPSDLI